MILRCNNSWAGGDNACEKYLFIFNKKKSLRTNDFSHIKICKLWTFMAIRRLCVALHTAIKIPIVKLPFYVGMLSTRAFDMLSQSIFRVTYTGNIGCVAAGTHGISFQPENILPVFFGIRIYASYRKCSLAWRMYVLCIFPFGCNVLFLWRD